MFGKWHVSQLCFDSVNTRTRYPQNVHKYQLFFVDITINPTQIDVMASATSDDNENAVLLNTANSLLSVTMSPEPTIDSSTVGPPNNATAALNMSMFATRNVTTCSQTLTSDMVTISGNVIEVALGKIDGATQDSSNCSLSEPRSKPTTPEADDTTMSGTSDEEGDTEIESGSGELVASSQHTFSKGERTEKSIVEAESTMENDGSRAAFDRRVQKLLVDLEDEIGVDLLLMSGEHDDPECLAVKGVWQDRRIAHLISQIEDLSIKMEGIHTKMEDLQSKIENMSIHEEG